MCDDYDVQQKEFYFDRNPSLFRYVLHFYQTGKLHIMEELCVFSFRSDLLLRSSHHHLLSCWSLLSVGVLLITVAPALKVELM